MKAINADKVDVSQQGKPLTIDRDILETEMNSGKVFEKVEKLPITKVVQLFIEASSAAFTICFRTKLDEKVVKDKLQKLN